MSSRYSYSTDKQMARVSIRRLGFRRNGPRNIVDPLATFQTPPVWHYSFLGGPEYPAVETATFRALVPSRLR